MKPNEVKFYPKPQEPTTCCGKGCEGCVWISYFEALDRWKKLFEQDKDIAV